MVMLVVVTTTHPLVLTVSHDSPVCYLFLRRFKAALASNRFRYSRDSLVANTRKDTRKLAPATPCQARGVNAAPAGSSALPNCGRERRNPGYRVTKQQPLIRNLLCGVAHLSSGATPRRSPIAGGA
jgi:hypothetical protein